MKPEIAHALFLPVLQTLQEANFAPEFRSQSDESEDEQPIKQLAWIDEKTFLQLLYTLIEKTGKNKFVAVGERLWADESIGLGNLLIPLAKSPVDLFREFVNQVNMRTRTFHLTIQQDGKQSFYLVLSTKSQPPDNYLIVLWLEGLLTAAQRLPFGLVCTSLARAPLPQQFDDSIWLCPLEKNSKTAPPTGGRVYLIRWKKTRRLRGKPSATDWEQVRESLMRARTIIHQQTTGLEQLQSRMRRQEALLKSIIDLSESYKSVRSFRELINLVATRICSDFGFDRSQIYLAREGQLEIATVIDRTDPTWAQRVYAVCQANPIRIDGRTEESRAFQSGRAVVVNNPWDNIFVPQAQLQAWKSRGYLICPIRGADRMIGIMVADHYYRRHSVESDDVDKLIAVANISGLALEKLRLIDRLEGKVAERTAELQRANKKLTKLYEKARESDHMKSEFLANMSHELRTPLNSIIGFSKVILKGIDGPLTDQQQVDLEAILNSGTHLLGLINDILDLSKIESGRMELNKEMFDLNELVDQVAATAEGLIKEKSIKLVKSIDRDMPIVNADKMRIRQVLLNLVSNAIKFTDKGKITITTKAGDKEFYIAVTDTGRGIPADKVDMAFEQFRQLDAGPARMQGGSGLGLTISKKFVEMHGGRIWVSSTEGIGSTFHFAIPLKTNEQMTT